MVGKIVNGELMKNQLNIKKKIFTPDNFVLFIFFLSIFLMVFDRLAIIPGIQISYYRVIQIPIAFIIILWLIKNQCLRLNPYNSTLILLIGFLIFSLIVTTFYFSPFEPFIEWLKLAQLAILAVLLSIYMKAVWKSKYWIFLAMVMFWCGLLGSISIITDVLDWTNFANLYIEKFQYATMRPFGVLGESNFAGGRLSILLPFAIYWTLKSSKNKQWIKTLFYLLSLLIIIIAIFMTGSRMSGIIVFFTIIFFFIREFRTFLQPKRMVFFIFLLVLVSIPIYRLLKTPSAQIFNFSLDRYKDLIIYLRSGESLGVDESIIIRKNVFYDGLRMFAKHPILGVGLGRFRRYSYRSAFSHNTFITFLAETGIFAFIFFIGFIFRMAWNLFYLYRKSISKDLYFYIGISFTNLLIMLFFLHTPLSKYLWVLYPMLSMFVEYIRKCSKERITELLL